MLGKAPQDEPSAIGFDRGFSDCRKGERKCGRIIAIRGRLDLMDPALLELCKRKLLPTERERGGKRGRPSQGGNASSTRRWPNAIALLLLLGGRVE
jgi:hypothetical protein